VADRFPSSLRAENNFPSEIQKADFDLLAKINRVFFELAAEDDAIKKRIDDLNVPTIVSDLTYGTYRSYPDGSTQGRVLTAGVVRSSPVSLVTSTAKTVCFIDLPPGKWMVNIFSGFLLNSATSVTNFIVAISKTDNSIPAIDATGVILNGEIRTRDQIPPTIGIIDFFTSIPPITIEITTLTRYYFTALSTFTINTCSAYGSIQAVSIL
jgi:hypothetical protein